MVDINKLYSRWGRLHGEKGIVLKYPSLKGLHGWFLRECKEREIDPETIDFAVCVDPKLSYAENRDRLLPELGATSWRDGVSERQAEEVRRWAEQIADEAGILDEYKKKLAELQVEAVRGKKRLGMIRRLERELEEWKERARAPPALGVAHPSLAPARNHKIEAVACTETAEIISASVCCKHHEEVHQHVTGIGVPFDAGIGGRREGHQDIEEESILTLKDVAKILGLSVTTLQRYADQGTVKCIENPYGRRLGISEDEVIGLRNELLAMAEKRKTKQRLPTERSLIKAEELAGAEDVRVLRLKEAAEFLGISVKTIQRMADKGEIIYVTNPHGWRLGISEGEVIKLKGRLPLRWQRRRRELGLLPAEPEAEARAEAGVLESTAPPATAPAEIPTQSVA